MAGENEGSDHVCVITWDGQGLRKRHTRQASPIGVWLPAWLRVL